MFDWCSEISLRFYAYSKAIITQKHIHFWLGWLGCMFFQNFNFLYVLGFLGLWLYLRLTEKEVTAPFERAFFMNGEGINELYLLSKDCLEKEDDLGGERFDVDPRMRTFSNFKYSSDASSESSYQYFFDSFQLMGCLINESFEPLGKKFDLVVNGSVQHSQLAERFSGYPESVRARYGQALEDLTRWQEIEDLELKLFVISKHPELFSRTKVLKYANEQKEIISKAVSHIVITAKNLGIEVEEDESGYTLRHPEQKESSESTSIDDFFSELTNKKLGVSKVGLLLAKRNLIKLDEFLRDNSVKTKRESLFKRIFR